MSSYSGLPTPPPLNADEYKEYVDGVFKDAATPFEDGSQDQHCEERTQYQRKMGDTELSYFLPARQSGVNDMYLHLGFHAPEHLVRRVRVRTVWAILRLRHPLLCARAKMHDYDDVRFVYDRPSCLDEVLADADANHEYRTEDKNKLIDSYLNGPRTLSNNRLSYLVLSQPLETLIPTPPPSPSADTRHDHRVLDTHEPGRGTCPYELLICAMHFIGDGMALHQYANDFFRLLGGGKSDTELDAMLDEEWQKRWGDSGSHSPDINILPPSLEASLPYPASSSTRLHDAASEIDHHLSNASLVGGQTLPRRKHAERHTVVPTISFPEARTKAMLGKCKERGVSISAALFAVCNIAWARVGKGRADIPAMMYSALNLRPYLAKKRVEDPWNSYWFLAIGYFNVILPNFLPAGNHEKTFWHRARQAKLQSAQAAKNKLVVARARQTAKERGERARMWAKEDDEKERGTWVPPTPPPQNGTSVEATPSIKNILPERCPAPSSALLGLSLLGNLDGIYAHGTFPAITLHTLTTGSRQRHGAILLFGYTFKGRLWVSMGYDQHGFEEGVVERFWGEIEACLGEFLG